MKCRTCRYLSDIDGLCSLNVDGTCVAILPIRMIIQTQILGEVSL